MLNQREEKTGAWLSGHGTCDIGKWSDFFPVCGKIVVKRKITAKCQVPVKQEATHFLSEEFYRCCPKGV